MNRHSGMEKAGIELQWQVNQTVGAGCLDCKFLCEKVSPPLKFVTRSSEIGVLSKEGKQKVF